MQLVAPHTPSFSGVSRFFAAVGTAITGFFDSVFVAIEAARLSEQRNGQVTMEDLKRLGM